jgi:hypothetical protein
VLTDIEMSGFTALDAADPPTPPASSGLRLITFPGPDIYVEPWRSGSPIFAEGLAGGKHWRPYTKDNANLTNRIYGICVPGSSTNGIRPIHIVRIRSQTNATPKLIQPHWPGPIGRMPAASALGRVLHPGGCEFARAAVVIP